MSYLDPTARSRARAEHSVSSEIGRDMRGNRVVQEGVWSEYVRKDPSHQQQKRSLFDGPPQKRNPSDVGGDELFGHLSCRVLPNPDAQRRGEYQGRRTTDLTPFVDLAAGPQARSRASRMVFREASIDEGVPADAPSPDEPTGVGATAGEQDALHAFMNKQQSELNARPGGGAGGHWGATPSEMSRSECTRSTSCAAHMRGRDPTWEPEALLERTSPGSRNYRPQGPQHSVSTATLTYADPTRTGAAREQQHRMFAVAPQQSQMSMAELVISAALSSSSDRWYGRSRSVSTDVRRRRSSPSVSGLASGRTPNLE